jgi:ribonuclease VapC
MGVIVEPVTVAHGQLAAGVPRFRQGPARSFGGCFAYALAKTTGEPPLFKGSDFDETDITPAA